MTVLEPQRRLDVEDLAVVLWLNDIDEIRTPSPGEVISNDVWVVPHSECDWIAVAIVDPSDQTLVRLAVQPEYRRQGIASELVESIAEEYGSLTARCRQSLAANRFYARTGWIEKEVLPANPEPLIEWQYTSKTTCDGNTTRNR
jgi:GNAT superfamily N-acetyltransferase